MFSEITKKETSLQFLMACRPQVSWFVFYCSFLCALRYIYQLRIRNLQTDRIAYTHRQLLDECMYVYITNSCWLYISVREYVFSQHIAITWIAFTWNNKQLRIYIANSYADSQWAAICVVHTHTSIYMYYNHFIFLFFFVRFNSFHFRFVCLFV